MIAAAVLLMQAAAVDGFDLATLGDGADPPMTAEEAVEGAATRITSLCELPDTPPEPAGSSIVICGRAPRTTYRLPPAEIRETPPRADERLADRTGCGVTLRASGCFQGVTVLKTTFGGGTVLLPTLTRPREESPDTSD